MSIQSDCARFQWINKWMTIFVQQTKVVKCSVCLFVGIVSSFFFRLLPTTNNHLSSTNVCVRSFVLSDYFNESNMRIYWCLANDSRRLFNDFDELPKYLLLFISHFSFTALCSSFFSVSFAFFFYLICFFVCMCVSFLCFLFWQTHHVHCFWLCSNCM